MSVGTTPLGGASSHAFGIANVLYFIGLPRFEVASEGPIEVAKSLPFTDMTPLDERSAGPIGMTNLVIFTRGSRLELLFGITGGALRTPMELLFG